MAAPAEPVLFQAVCTPPRSFTRAGFGVLAGLLGGFAGLAAAMFLALGAWPILPFLGLEVGFALVLVALHARGAARATEVLLLTRGEFRVCRTDARGRREETVLDAYWARLTYRENPAHAGVLRLESRGRAVEIGRDLSAEEKMSLRDALAEALARARRPDFDNPQLRDG
ncbi:DUF2244 domain-containing protein [Roseomonas eburnea]|uniref:DUF2244 domain-containing protein n=1 Tax=Neoroseomonas eburnea TaxID=1346889 RepID=A0A9X9XBM1_9PROT|nr:DUF2244 domain-containing protein [Neoroseomonas eburnea]MBR0681107.1 DUF2244 domain-containing protein [Neoroseomonas eburnea]